MYEVVDNVRQSECIDVVKQESPTSGWHKGKNDDDVVFAAMIAAKW